MNDEIFLNERVQVIAVFGAGLHPCRPRKFRRPNSREIDITEIGIVHPTVQAGGWSICLT